MTADEAAARLPAALARGDWAGAAEALRVLALAHPANASVRYNLGLALRRQGLDAAALEALTAAVRLDPSHANARFERAACRMDLGDLGEAHAEFTAYCRDVPDDPDGWLNLGRLALRLGDAAGAVAAFDRCLAVRPDDGEARIGRAEALTLAGRAEGPALLRALYAERPQDRPRLLKAMTQAPRGRLPLSARALVGPR